MNSLVRKVVIAAFVLSLAPIVPRIGKVFAQTAPDFTFIANGTKADITYETSNSSCIVNPYHVLSCEPFWRDAGGIFWHSDSYSVNAELDVSNATEFGRQLTSSGLIVTISPFSYCSQSFPLSEQYIPGNAVHKTAPDNGKFTIYSFDGNAPGVNSFAGSYGFDHLEMNLMVNNSDPANSALHIQANANLCNFLRGPLTAGQPVSMGVQIVGSSNHACVNLTPTYSTKDMGPDVCSEP